MSATYFDTGKPRARDEVRREKAAAAVAPREIRRFAPGIGLGLGAIASIGMWVVIAKVALGLIS